MLRITWVNIENCITQPQQQQQQQQQRLQRLQQCQQWQYSCGTATSARTSCRVPQLDQMRSSVLKGLLHAALAKNAQIPTSAPGHANDPRTCELEMSKPFILPEDCLRTCQNTRQSHTRLTSWPVFLAPPHKQPPHVQPVENTTYYRHKPMMRLSLQTRSLNALWRGPQKQWNALCS